MKNTAQIEIPLSKSKMRMTFLGAVGFVGLGLFLLIKPPKTDHWLFVEPTYLLITGIASVIFFGLVAITVFRKLSDHKAGLVINNQGIYDNSSGVSAGLIPWTDIQAIKTFQVLNQKFIMVMVSNPQDYLDRQANPMIRKTMHMNHKTYGSSISISSNALETNFDELRKLLLEKMNEYKS